MPKVNLGGVDLNYECYGQGQPIIFVSGMTQNMIPWTLYQVPHFSECGYQCVVLDNRDTGQTTDKSNQEYTIQDLKNDVVGLADHLNLEQFHLVGYSMGGMIGIQLALDSPDRLATLTLLGSSAETTNYDISKFNYLLEAKEKLEPEFFYRMMMDKVLTWRYFENDEAVEKLISFLISDLNHQTIDGMRRQANAIKSFDARSNLSYITVPTHVLVGEEDMMLAPRHSEQLALNIPNSKLSIIPEAGHSAYSEKAEVFNELALEFISVNSMA